VIFDIPSGVMKVNLRILAIIQVSMILKFKNRIAYIAIDYDTKVVKHQEVYAKSILVTSSSYGMLYKYFHTTSSYITIISTYKVFLLEFGEKNH